MDVFSYDIKNEQEYLRTCQNPIQKFYKYRTTKDEFDCDVSYFALQEACKIYPYLAHAKIEKQNENNRNGYKFELYLQDNYLIYRGDTCNSFHTLYRRAVKTLISGTEYLDACNRYGDAKNEYLHDLLAEHSGLSLLFEEMLPPNVGALLKEFAVINHTLPNMITLPKGLNAPRYMLTSDNFSLFLYSVYHYLNHKNIYFCEKMFGDAIEMAKTYLSTFRDWSSYIEANYLESYLDDNKVPKEFIRGQFERFKELAENTSSVNKETIEKYTCPQNTDEYIEYLTNMISILKNRRIQMSAVYTK